MGGCNSTDMAHSSYTSTYTRKTLKMAEHDSKLPAHKSVASYSIDPKFICKRNRAPTNVDLQRSQLLPVGGDEQQAEKPSSSHSSEKQKVKRIQTAGASKSGLDEGKNITEILSAVHEDVEIDMVPLDESCSHKCKEDDHEATNMKDMKTTDHHMSRKSVVKSITNPDESRPKCLKKLQTKVINLDLQVEEELADLSGSNQNTFNEELDEDDALQFSRRSFHKTVTMN